MLGPIISIFRAALEKSEQAYGESIKRDLNKAIERVLTKQGALDRSFAAMEIETEKKVIIKQIKKIHAHLKMLWPNPTTNYTASL